MKTESEGPQAYEDFICEEGCPTLLWRDNSKMQTGDDFTSINRHFCVKDGYTEPYHPHQNPAENHAACWLTHHGQTVMNITGAPDYVWPDCLTWIADVHNFTANEALGNRMIYLPTSSSPFGNKYYTWIPTNPTQTPRNYLVIS